MKRICLSVERDESILAVMNNGQLEELLIENALEEDLVGRIYKGVVKNLLPSVNGIFIDIGIAIKIPFTEGNKFFTTPL